MSVDSTYTASSLDSQSKEMSIDDNHESNKENDDSAVEDASVDDKNVFTLNNLQRGKNIGKGAFGTIFLAQLKKRYNESDPKVIAVKCISKRRVEKRRLLKQL